MIIENEPVNTGKPRQLTRPKVGVKYYEYDRYATKEEALEIAKKFSVGKAHAYYGMGKRDGVWCYVVHLEQLK
jgi:hypothetical protein